MNYTHAIITYAKTHYLIDAEQEKKLRDLKSHNQFRVDGNIIMGSNIAEVMTIQKYYETYPDKRPAITNRYKEIPGMGMENIIATSHKQALDGITKGLRNYINSSEQNPLKNWYGEKRWYQGTDGPKELLKMAEKKIALANN